jgi:hypothetical protein
MPIAQAKVRVLCTSVRLVLARMRVCGCVSACACMYAYKHEKAICMHESKCSYKCLYVGAMNEDHANSRNGHCWKSATFTINVPIHIDVHTHVC